MIIGSFTPTLVLPPQGGGDEKRQSFPQGGGYDRNKSILQEGGNEKG